MSKEALEVEPAKPDQKLDPMSRLNFGKVYTVEHNVKVLPVGRITDGSMARFNSYVRYELAHPHIALDDPDASPCASDRSHHAGHGSHA